MSKYITKIGFCVGVIILLYAVLGSFANGNTDFYYLRFTTPKQSHLILGNSRAAQGIQPDILNSKINPSHDFYNYSFNIIISPYGSAYFKAIKEKLNENTKSGIYILQVDPWSISNPKGSKKFNENHSFINNLHCYNCNPNYEYLLKNYHQSWFDLYKYRDDYGKRSIFLNNNGWLEVNISLDSVDYIKKEREKIAFYKKSANLMAYSYKRIDYLKKMINYLKNHGSIYLVRMPQSSQLSTIENEYMPQFDSIMKNLTQELDLHYFNFISLGEKYTYTDGNHLSIKGGAKLSSQLSDSILKYSKPIK